MSADPRGRWFRVYARQVRQHPKFRDLNVMQLGAWLTLRSEAELRDGSVFSGRSEAILMLRRRGCSRAAAMVDGLVALALFDLQEDGTLTVHDRADHDRGTFPSDDPDKVRERVQKHRSKKERNESETSGNEKETTPVQARSGAGVGADSVPLSEDRSREDDDDQEEAPEGWDAPDAVVAYHDLTGSFPSKKVIDWLNRMSDDHPEEAIIRVMAEQYTADPNPGTLLSRTDTALKLDAHRRAKADERARAKSQAAIEAPFRKQEQEATPEQKEQAKFQKKAIRIGIEKGINVPTDASEVRKFVMKHGAA